MRFLVITAYAASLLVSIAPQKATSDQAFENHLAAISRPNAAPEPRFDSATTFVLAGGEVSLNLPVLASMAWPNVSKGRAGTSTFGDWMTSLRSLGPGTRSNQASRMVEPIDRAYRRAVRGFVLALVDDRSLYAPSWTPSSEDALGDGIVIGEPCQLMVGSTRHRGLRGAAIVWDSGRRIKAAERNVSNLVATRGIYAGSSVQEAYIQPHSESVHVSGGARNEAWSFYVHDDPDGFGDFKFSLVMFDTYFRSGRIKTCYRVNGKDYGADMFDELAGEDEYIPLLASNGDLVGTLMVSSLVLEYSLSYWLGSGEDSDSDRRKALNGGIGNTKRVNQKLNRK